MNVSWETPQFPNGVLEGYRLVYEPCTPVDGEWGPPSPTPKALLLSGSLHNLGWGERLPCS